MLAIHGGKPVRTTPFTAWPVFDETDEQALLDVLRSGKWGLGGVRTAAFEARFATFHDARYGVAVANGTVALHVALVALGIGPGDEVIIPAYTFVATGAAVLHTGATPVIVDIDPDTYTMDATAVEAAITEHTKCIMPVHVAGNVAHMNKLRIIASNYGLPIIEDAAQAHGAQWQERGVGSLGAMGTFSFQATKNLNAGEGGMIVTNDRTLAARCRALRNCGRTDEPGLGSMLGWNFRMTEFQASLLDSQMNRLGEQADRRADNARYLTEQLSRIPGIGVLTAYPEVTRHAYHLYVFRFRATDWGVSLAVFLRALAAERIPCTRGYVPLYRDPSFVVSGASCPAAWPQLQQPIDQHSYRGMMLPNAERASEEAVWLPHTTLLGARTDVDDIVAAVNRLWEQKDELRKVDDAGDSLRYAGLDG